MHWFPDRCFSQARASHFHALQGGLYPQETSSVDFCPHNLTTSAWEGCVDLNNQPPLNLSYFRSAKPIKDKTQHCFRWEQQGKRKKKKKKKKGDRDLFLCKNWCFCLSLIPPNFHQKLIHRSQVPQLWQTGRWIQVLERKRSNLTRHIWSLQPLCSGQGGLATGSALPWGTSAAAESHRLRSCCTAQVYSLLDTIRSACPQCPLRKVRVAHWWGALSPSEAKTPAPVHRLPHSQ